MGQLALLLGKEDRKRMGGGTSGHVGLLVTKKKTEQETENARMQGTVLIKVIYGCYTCKY